MTPPTAADGAIPGWAWAGGALSLVVVGLEVAGNLLGASPTASYPGWLVPIAWPTPLRVASWLAAAAGSVAANRGLAKISGRRRLVQTVATAALFVGFAVGIALGAEWATWH